ARGIPPTSFNGDPKSVRTRIQPPGRSPCHSRFHEGQSIRHPGFNDGWYSGRHAPPVPRGRSRRSDSGARPHGEGEPTLEVDERRRGVAGHLSRPSRLHFAKLIRESREG